MKVVLHIILIINCFISYGQDDCIKYDSKKYVPINLNDALNYLDCKWSDSDKEFFKNKKENDAVGGIHHGTGRAIRNSWGLWKGNSEIANYFHELDINHPDDMSSIILTSFHRHLNQKKILLQKQVQFYKEYWVNVEEKEKKRLDDEFKEYEINDTVEFNFPYEFLSKTQEEHYMNDTCYPKGIILDKNNKEHSLRISLLSSCGADGIITYEGDKYEEKNDKLILKEKNIREIMKTGDIKWLHYEDWDPLY